jgi:hypothetical protein
MAAPKTFDEYWDIVVSNDLWYDNIKMRHARKDIRGIAQEAFIDLLTQPTRLAIADPTDFQQHLSKFLMYAKESPVKPELQQAAPKEEPADPNNPPLTGEARQKKIKEFLDIILSFDGNAIRPLLNEQVKENGQTDPPKPRGHEYPFTPLEYQQKIDERVRKGREILFRERNPNATEQDIENYLNSF